MKKVLYLISLVCAACGTGTGHFSASQKLDGIASEYVRAGLAIGQYDADFVDAYYGPDTLRPSGPPSAVFPKDSLLGIVAHISAEIDSLTDKTIPDSVRNRARWIRQQLTAFSRRIRIFAGETVSFEQECKDLFGVTVPRFAETDFQTMLLRLDTLLPGKGDVAARFQQLANRFIIPPARLDTVFKTAIAECRKRTLAHYQLPASEDFQLSFVTDKPWNGYNWYKGHYQSLIQVNTDMPIFIDRVIDVGSHESYPGHHVYNMLLEKTLYADKKRVEISLYPLFSPQSLIAEGSANYGIELAFPGNDRARFSADVLLPLAKLDTSGIALYFRARDIHGQLAYARNEVARGLINGTMTETEALRWLMQYSFFNKESALKSIAFIRKYRSYVINYNYGKDLVKAYVEGSGENAWDAFGRLLSTQVTTDQLEKNVKP